jgi:hypothetical protein
MSHEPEQYDALPDAIVERLRSRDRAVSILTPEIDRQVAEAARQQFATRRSRSGRTQRWRYPAAVAALAALVALFLVRPLDTPSPSDARLADDVDGSGQVDVLDAYALARRRAEDPSAVSQERIDRLTRRIVSLSASEVTL